MSYVIDDNIQGSQGWLDVRKKLSLTGSKFGDVHLFITTGKPMKTDLVEPNEAMKKGTELEPIIRNWFINSKYMEEGWEMKELGIAIPTWNDKIGSSIDGGIYYQGKMIAIIEIKCPANIYPELYEKTDEYDMEKKHIKIYHYDQMQGAMAILEVPLCFYIVYGHETGNVYVEKVGRNEDYWNNELYPSLLKYINISK